MFFFKNVTVFESKRRDVFKKRGGLFGVGRKWDGTTSTTISFALISIDMGARCLICMRVLIFIEGNGHFILSLI